jgi:hypothetical protein
MAHKLRVEYAGAIDHVMNRGDRRERIIAEVLKRGWGRKPISKLSPRGIQ